MPVPPPEGGRSSARDYPLDEIATHIEQERRQVSLLGEIREIVFGAQDGLVSTLAVVATVVGATDDNVAVLIAGLASAMAGVFSMAIGEYIGSKSQREIFAWHIADEWQEVVERPFESEAEVAYLFIQEGMDEEDAWRTAHIISEHPRALLATMVQKELGLPFDPQDETSGTPLRGAVFMGASFALGAIVPVVPFLVSSGLPALAWATALTGLVLFVIGAIKARWTHRSWVGAGLEVVGLAGVAGVAGYLFGTFLPRILGFSGVV